ncbi:flavin reductase family protein [Mesoterricola sediminis]|uniref:Flavin reductase n=1 Tax=Mesoterricola sediminis TaxID=2927980 RepID=A0AA48KBH5_9BACT|nr:flavin reductase family protein [Mesoterricola sediminis]BDU76114.1 flavin reductase [Mesoterricola sediminis]
MRTVLPGDLTPAATNALLCAGVAPRPIALASTVSAAGIRNLAPFSFFNAFGSNPPMVAFAPNRRARDGTVKHTWLNATATREFVIAAVSHAMLHQMNLASAEFPEGVDEFGKSGLTPAPARFVAPALVAESPFQMECTLVREVELGTGPGSGLLLIGEVVAFHLRDDLSGSAHPDQLDLVGRNGGAWYTRASGPALLEVAKPAGCPAGFDALPDVLRNSRILTGNDLGRLAGVGSIPDPASAEARPGDPGEVEGLERAIQAALAREDLGEAWRLAGRRVRMGAEGR